MKVAAIVLAAGKSERMGKNKLLLSLEGKTIIERVLDSLKTAKIDEIIVVLGHKFVEIRNAIDRSNSGYHDIKIVVNEQYEEGMISSFKKGLKQVMKKDAVFLILGDQLILNPKFLDLMIEKMRMTDGDKIIVPIFKEKKGHPVLFSKKFFKELLKAEREETIREIINRNMNFVVKVQAEEWINVDIDTPEDFIRIKNNFKIKE